MSLPCIQQQQRFINPNSLTQQQQQQLQQIQDQHHNSNNSEYNQFMKRQQQQQQHTRRFSYTSMLSDAEQCYLPSNSSPSNDSDDYVQQETPPPSSVSPVSVTSFIDPIYVDIQTKYHPQMMNQQQQQQQIHYYDPHQKSFSSNNLYRNNSMMHFPMSNSMCSMNKNISRPVTPVSPPLILKDNYHQPNNLISSSTATTPTPTSNNKIKKTPRSRGRRVSNIPGCNSRMFTCKADSCGKVFKRSEHLKRHIRSIHTLEKRK